jgi:hypothetical protein
MSQYAPSYALDTLSIKDTKKSENAFCFNNLIKKAELDTIESKKALARIKAISPQIGEKLSMDRNINVGELTSSASLYSAQSIWPSPTPRPSIPAPTPQHAPALFCLVPCTFVLQIFLEPINPGQQYSSSCRFLARLFHLCFL